ncbi:MAG: hypothetical protein AAGF97_02090 [Planctomycetota bacterium]
MTGCLPLIATSRTYLQFTRLQSLDEWWHWGALASLVLAMMLVVTWIYRRDAVELPKPLHWLLVFLRVSLLLGLLLFFLGLEQRSEELLVRNSRALVLVDASQSMALADGDGETTPARIDVAVDALQGGASEGLVEALRARHDVVVYRCDERQRPTEIAAYPTLASQATPASENSIGSFEEARRLVAITATLGLVAVLGLALAAWPPSLLVGAEGENWAWLVGIVFAVAAFVFAAVNSIRNPEYSYQELITGRPTVAAVADVAPEDTATAPEVVDLGPALRTSGTATRLGDALSSLIDQERGGPIAGITVLTDGNSNAGVTLRDAAGLASTANIPVYTVGLGNDRPPVNARLVDVEAPARVFPGDGFTIKAFLQAFGYAGTSLPVRLIRLGDDPASDPNGDETPSGLLLDERLVPITADGDVISVEFEVDPEELGTTRYEVVVVTPPTDVDGGDNTRQVSVKIVDRKTRVLLLAGGPTREYRFVRNLCYRDDEVEVDVLLQGASGNAAQEADAILESFPANPDELFEYDAIIAFDPDWEQLTESQLRLLDQWVAEKAGGLILVAGPVYTPEWTARTKNRASARILRALYPVQFYSRTSRVLGRNRYLAKAAWPLEFTADGLNAPHLQLGDASVWDDFAGVYGYFPVRGVKPAASVLARFSNPDTRIEEELPPFLAYQFYGAGRVYYIGSGELWRLHQVSVAAFESFYTKLIRFVSEGRLLRDSNRGVLMVDKDRVAPGEKITIRCNLTDAQFKPSTLPEVAGVIIAPDGSRQTITLMPSNIDGREGNFMAQVSLSEIGDYRIEVPVPDSPDLEILTKSLRLRVPDREIENPQRNDAKLSELAELTGGVYLVAQPENLATTTAELAARLEPQDQRTYVPGSPDRAFQQRLMLWYLVLFCGVLSIEWLIRRLNRLA